MIFVPDHKPRRIIVKEQLQILAAGRVAALKQVFDLINVTALIIGKPCPERQLFRYTDEPDLLF